MVLLGSNLFKLPLLKGATLGPEITVTI